MRIAGLNPLTFVPPIGDGISMSETYEMQLEDARLEAGIPLSDFYDLPGSHIWLGKKWHLCLADILVSYQMRRGKDAIINHLQTQKARAK